MLEKERIMTVMIYYDLWQSETDVNEGLKIVKSETQKHQSLKAQLRFRKAIIQQTYDANKDVYKFLT